MGSNVTKGIYAYDQMTGSKLDPNDTDAILEELRMNGGLPVVGYTITLSRCRRSLRRGDPGGLFAQGAAAVARLYLDYRNAGRTLPHG